MNRIRRTKYRPEYTAFLLKVKYLLLALFFLPSCYLSAFAQEIVSQDRDSTATLKPAQYFLEEVIITAPRSEQTILKVPQAITVLQEKEIQRAELGLSLEESLREIPGVVVNDRHNLSQGDRISIRGMGSRASFGVRGIKVILDGIPLSMPDGQSQLNNLDLSSAGKIEVLRGPSSYLYGNAAGGLVKIQSQIPANKPLLLQPRFIVGDHGLQKWQVKISGSSGRHSYLISTSRLTFDGFREHAFAKINSVNGVTKHELNNHLDLTTTFSYVDAPYLFNPSSLAKEDAGSSPESARFFVQSQGASKKVEQAQGGVTLRYENENNRFETTIYGIARSLLNPIPGRIIELDRTAGGVRTVLNKRLGGSSKAALWTVGADLEIQQDRRSEFENLGLPRELVGAFNDDDIFEQIEYGQRLQQQDEEVLAVGVFSKLEFAVNPNLNLTFAARYDRFRFKVDDEYMGDGIDDSGSRTMDKISPMIGISYRLQPDFAIYANLTTGFQTPTTTELSNRPNGTGGFNPALEPEKMQSFEIGLKRGWPKRNLDFETAIYILNIRDMLIPFQIQDAMTEEVFFRNAGKTQNRGFELSANWQPFHSLRASFAYSFMDFVFRDFFVESSLNSLSGLTQLKGNNVPGVPSHHLFLDLTYEHVSGGYAELNLQWWDETFANDFNGPQPGSTNAVEEFINPAYSIVDLRFGRVFQFIQFGLNVFVGLNNVFDTRYNSSIVPNAFGNRFFEPAPGRSWYGGVTFVFPHQ